LSATGVGVLASMERALEAFGQPHRRATRNLGLGPAPEVDWTWRLGREELELQFDSRRRMLTGYCTDSPRLATADGVRVGQVSTGMLARRYGRHAIHAVGTTRCRLLLGELERLGLQGREGHWSCRGHRDAAEP